MKYLMLSSLFCFIMLACKTIQTKSDIYSSSSYQSKLETLAREKYTDDYRVKTNDDNSYSIVITNTNAKHELFPQIEFFIYEHFSGKIIFEDQLKAGAVKWENAYQIQAIARNLEEEDGITRRVYYFDVRTKTKK